MFTATAVRVLAPASVALLLAIYKYLKSGGKTEFPEPVSPYPGGGGEGGAAPHRQDDHPQPPFSDRAPPDVYLAILYEIRKLFFGGKIRKLDPALLDAILKLPPDPVAPIPGGGAHPQLRAPPDLDAIAKPVEAHLDEILDLIRNRDLADGTVDEVGTLGLEEKKQGEQEAGGSSWDWPREDEPEIGNGGEGEEEKKVAVEETGSRKSEGFPAGECWKYLKNGTCKNRPNCKWNHPPRSEEEQDDVRSEGCKNGEASTSNHSKGQQPSVGEKFMGLPSRPVSQGKKKKKELAEKPGRTESKVSEDKAKEKGAEKPSQTDSKFPARSIPAHPSYVMINNFVTGSNILTKYPYQNQVEEFPERPGQPVCSSFLSTGGCNLKDSCKYHHPKIHTAGSPSYTLSDKGLPLRPDDVRSEGCKNGKASTSNHSKGQPSVGEKFMGLPSRPVSKRKAKKKKELAEKSGRTESKNDFRSEKCNSGKARTSNHSRGQPSVAAAGENFLGLPIRPGAENCPDYMQNGLCKYELNCKYSHPDPEAAEGT